MRRGAKPGKAKVNAKPPGARTAKKGEGARVRDLEKRLAEALKGEAEALRQLQTSHRERAEAQEQQAATAEILRVISSSPTDIQFVFDTIVRTAARLCDAFDANLLLADGDEFVQRAHHGPIGAPIQDARYPVRGTVSGRAISEARIIQVDDLAAATEYPLGSELAQRIGYRTTLVVPLVRDGLALGAIGIRRTEVLPFNDRQIALLETFADQAVIAIENARLFTELQTSNRELTTALDTQTATSDILRVISRSTFDVKPVFETIVKTATRLCDADGGLITTRHEEGYRAVATFSKSPEYNAATLGRWVPVTRGSVAGRTALEGRVIHIADLAADPEYTMGEVVRLGESRTALGVPLLRNGDVLGTLNLSRHRVQPFNDRQIELVRTFADQAVIAIENVRLFTELDARNADVTDTLARETATGEVLRAISRAQTDAQPVFDIIAESAQRLCGAGYGQVALYDGALLHMTAFHNVDPEGVEALRRRFPAPADRSSAMGRALQTRAVVQIPDVSEDSAYAFKTELQTMGFHSLLVVPMLRKDEPIGAIAVGRLERGQFPDKQVELLQTFADQAVIAIENVSLFQELQARTRELARSVEELKALGEVGQAVSSTLDLETVLKTIVTRAVQLSGSDSGIVYEFDQDTQTFHARSTHRVTSVHLDALRATPIRLGEGAVGHAAVIRTPVRVPNISDERQFVAPQTRSLLVREGLQSLLAVPFIREEHVLGGLVILRREPGAFSSEVVAILQTFATQSALAIQNARLFEEIADKSRQLEAASHHKSEFLANMSHELRTPLNAIIGYSEMLQEEAQDRHQEVFIPDLEKINAAAKHQLSLINDILDLSKVEAGRMELEIAAFDLPAAIDNALTLVREGATRRGIALGHTIGDQVGVIHADERKIKQVLLNLLSNALKFTPEGGRIDVTATVSEALVEVAVSDTGVGIAPEDQAAVFEEFRQVGTADKKVEGTGLGLALCRRFVELHGGRIWVTSEVGQGATFAFTLPVRREA